MTAPLFYDSHAHLDFEALAGDPAVSTRAFEAGVRRVLVPGVDPAQWARALHLDGGPLELAFAVGLHPSFEGARFGGADFERDLCELDAWVDRLEAVAIGELGWHANSPYADELVDAQLDLARARELPVILHVVGAHGHALERLRRHEHLQGVVHAYSGSVELVREYVKLGLHISIGPSVLRPGARKVRAAAVAVPSERLLIETDAPDQIGEPADVARVARALAELRSVSLCTLAASTFHNAEALFHGGLGE